MRIVVATFNMGERSFSGPEEIAALFASCDFSEVDLVIVGLQEALPSAANDVVTYLANNGLEDIAELDLMANCLVCCGKREVKQNVLHLKWCSKAAKNGKVGLRNKGGIALSVEFKDGTSLCFVTVHLASFRRYLNERNQDAKDILDAVDEQLRPQVPTAWQHMFFFGDLNYRLESLSSGEFNHHLRSVKADESDAEQREGNQKDDHSAEEKSTVLAWIAEKQWGRILSRCQLKQALLGKPGTIFSEFQESAEFTFPPTFKLSKHDPPLYDCRRLPAYCDRILWRSYEGTRPLHQVSIDSPSGVTCSDHRPVLSLFELE